MRIGKSLVLVMLFLSLVFAGCSSKKRTLLVSEEIYNWWNVDEYEDICEQYGIEWKRDPETGKYEYPITPESDPELWGQLGHTGMIAVTYIPEYVVQDVTDEELLELVIKYPLALDTYGYNSRREGMMYVSQYCPCLKLVLDEGIVEKYGDKELERGETEGAYDDTEMMFLKYLKEYADNMAGKQ